MIGPDEIEYEIDITDIRSVRFHSKCLAAWHELRAERITEEDTPRTSWARGSAVPSGAGVAADDTVGVIATLMIERPLCASCIASKANIATGELPASLHRIGSAFAVRDEVGRCRECGAVTTVFSLTQQR